VILLYHFLFTPRRSMKNEELVGSDNVSLGLSFTLISRQGCCCVFLEEVIRLSFPAYDPFSADIFPVLLFLFKDVR